MRGVKHTHHPLVAGKQAGHTTRRGGVHRKQLARHMQHAAQRARTRHVNAVVIARAQVNGGEMAVGKLRGQLGVAAHQRLRAVVVAFGLKNLVALYRAKLADGAVHRTHPRRVGQRAGAGLERAGEKLVESGKRRWVALLGLGHVHLVLANKAANHRLRDATEPRTGQRTGELRHRLFGQNVLKGYKQGVVHGHSGRFGRRHCRWPLRGTRAAAQCAHARRHF